MEKKIINHAKLEIMSSYDRVSIIDREGSQTKEKEYLTMSHREERENKINLFSL